MYDQLKKEFINSNTYKKICTKYPNIYDEYHDFLLDGSTQPMEDIEGLHILSLHSNGVFFTAFFYYLQLVIDAKYKHIADVGCGINFVKDYVPGVVGYDRTPMADHQEFFDDDFVKNHAGEFDSAFAVNSLHFISLDKFAQRVDDFCKIVVPGGRVFATFNAARSLERTPDATKLEYFNTVTPSIEQISQYFDDQVAQLRHKTIYYHNTLLSVKSRNADICKLRPASYNDCKGGDWPEYRDYLVDNYQNCSQHIINEIDECTQQHLRLLSDWEMIDDIITGNIRLVLETQQGIDLDQTVPELS